MAIDLEAIRRRMAELNGSSRKTSSIQLWKPGPGEYKVRCLPWKNVPEGQPFQERWFYYIGANSGILTPKQFGKPDAIDDLVRNLFKSGKQDDRALAKKLMPKMRSYAPVIVRGQEDKGVQVWSFGKIVYQRLLGFFVDEDYGDILDPTEGFDLKVTVSQQPGKQYQDTLVDCKGRPSPLHTDPKLAQTWLDAVPNLDDMYRLKSSEEIEKILNTWLNSGQSDDVSGTGNTQSEGTTRGPTTPDALDALVKDARESTASAQPAVVAKVEEKPVAPAPKKPRKPSVDDDEAPVKKQSLDDAFKELMDDE